MIEAKLIGKDKIVCSEAFGLAKYYGCKIEYMFSHELSVIQGKPEAYWRWLDENNRKKEEAEHSRAVFEIYEELKEKPYLIDFMKTCISLSEKQREKVLKILQKTGAN